MKGDVKTRSADDEEVRGRDGKDKGCTCVALNRKNKEEEEKLFTVNSDIQTGRLGQLVRLG